MERGPAPSPKTSVDFVSSGRSTGQSDGAILYRRAKLRSAQMTRPMNTAKIDPALTRPDQSSVPRKVSQGSFKNQGATAMNPDLFPSKPSAYTSPFRSLPGCGIHVTIVETRRSIRAGESLLSLLERFRDGIEVYFVAVAYLPIFEFPWV